MPVPESSGWAGQPPFAHNAAISATIFGSVTRRASPATITSKPFVATLIVQRRSRATFFALRVRSPRSEEHTSELQSHHDLVCRLLLEKKKKKKKHTQNTEKINSAHTH